MKQHSFTSEAPISSPGKGPYKVQQAFPLLPFSSHFLIAAAAVKEGNPVDLLKREAKRSTRRQSGAGERQ